MYIKNTSAKSSFFKSTIHHIDPQNHAVVRRFTISKLNDSSNWNLGGGVFHTIYDLNVQILGLMSFLYRLVLYNMFRKCILVIFIRCHLHFQRIMHKK